MGNSERYRLNPETLEYEIFKRPKRWVILSYVGRAIGIIGAVALLWYLYLHVFGFDLPKTAMLKQVNDGWSAKIDIIEKNIERCDGVLSTLQVRDDDVYRALLGMNPIDAEVRNAGFGGVNRYPYLEGAEFAKMKRTMMRLDVLTKKSYVQSKSYDEVSLLAKKVDEMQACIPSISPIVPDKNNYRITSPFGTRTDPFTGRVTDHSGMDFAMPSGSPVYSPGNGQVVQVIYSRSGYGNQVIIDHGFGYKTLYAHLSSIFVEEGQTVQRGDFIGKVGSTGRSTGPHLHYEVMYMGRKVNPFNYIDLDIPVAEYDSMIRHVEAESGFALHPSHRK